MLSDTDIKRELGKHLLIYPLRGSNIKGASINLTASRYAWSLETKKSIVEEDVIVIPAHDTGLIETEENIAVSGRLAGTYHSRVKTVSAGGGHVGTTLNPYWIGHSLIAIHNHLDRPIEIKVGEPFVTLVLDYLNRAAKHEEENQPGRVDILQTLELSKAAINWLNEEPHATKDWKRLKELMQKEPEYGDLTRRGQVRNILMIIGLLLLGVGLGLILAFCPVESRWYKVLPVAMSGYGVIIGEQIGRHMPK